MLPLGAARMVRLVDSSVVPGNRVRVTVTVTPPTTADVNVLSVVKLFQFSVFVVQEAAAAGDVRLSTITGAVQATAPAPIAARIIDRRDGVPSPTVAGRDVRRGPSPPAPRARREPP